MQYRCFGVSIVLVLALALSSCSNSPKQQDRSGPEMVSFDQKQVEPVTYGIGESDPSAKLSYDDIVRKNAIQPILYKKGAGGITFRTSFVESQKILAGPEAGSDTADSETEYESGLSVHWYSKGDQLLTPRIIAVGKGYLGTMDIGGVAMQTGRRLTDLFSGSFTAKDPKGDTLLMVLYNILEKTGDNSFNCLAQGKCLNTIRDKVQIFQWDGFALGFSSDEKRVVEIAMIADPGDKAFESTVSMPSGYFPISSPKDPKDWLILGSPLSVFSKVVKAKPVPERGWNHYEYHYNNVTLGVMRTDYSEKAYTPAKTDIVDQMTLSMGYRFPILLGGSFIHYKENKDKDGFDFRVSALADTEGGKIKLEEDEKLFRMAMGLPPALQTKFLNQLGSHMVDELKKEVPELLASRMVVGEFRDSLHLSRMLSLGFYDPKKDEGRTFEIHLNSADGNITRLTTGLLSKSANVSDVVVFDAATRVADVRPPAEPKKEEAPATPKKKAGGALGQLYKDKKAVPAVEKKGLPLTAGLSGYYLGQTINYDEIKGEIAEATVSVPDHHDAKYRVRASFGAKQNMMFQPGKEEIIPLHVLIMGRQLPVVLGIVPFRTEENDANGNPKLTGRVASISSSFLHEGITGICGLDKFVVKMGMSENAFLDGLSAAITAKEADGKTKVSCVRHMITNSNISGTLSGIYFPNDRAKILFADGEVGGAMVYMEPREVQRYAREKAPPRTIPILGEKPAKAEGGASK